MTKKQAQIFLIVFFSLLLASPVFSQTIAEKKASLVSGGVSELDPEMRKYLIEINRQVKELRTKAASLQRQVTDLYISGAPEESYLDLLLKINDARENIRILQESWREAIAKQGMSSEGYALWHQPDTTIEQLISDYGSSDYVYLIAPEIASVKLSVLSNIPIPRSSWGEILEQILLQNGVGIKQLNPYLRLLYQVNSDLSELSLITNNPKDLYAYPEDARIGFVLTPEPMEVQRIWYFLEKFTNTNTTTLQRIGRVILIVGEVQTVKDLLKIYDFVIANKQELNYKAVALARVDAEEMAKILTAVFEQFTEEAQVETEQAAQLSPLGKPQDKSKLPQASLVKPAKKSGKNKEVNALNVIALAKVARAVFLIGTQEEIAKAEEIIKDVEDQVAGARAKEIYWYHVKHTDPEELADVLSRIHYLMIKSELEMEVGTEEAERKLKEQGIQAPGPQTLAQPTIKIQEPPQITAYQQSYYQQGGYVVNPRPAEPAIPEKREFNKDRTNFIVDPKSNKIVMVVEADLLPKIKDVIKQLDVPAKMVQIEVLLFEKKMLRANRYGLNLFKLGSAASNTDVSSLIWNDPDSIPVPPFGTLGVLEFLFSRPSYGNHNNAFDLSYKFLMSQDDVHINASPSVVALNQTTATISILDEISVNTGVYQVQTTGGTTLQDAFTRAQYGITIEVTPTIHMADEDRFGDPNNYVTLVSDITFDTFAPSPNAQQPNVTRRHIHNETRIPDSQTVIIGGLRRKNSADSHQYVPYLGEIPGFGKLFSTTSLNDDDTDMIVFITPKIIVEPVEDFAKLRAQEMCKRPGDLPMFLKRLNDALLREKNRLFEGYMTFLFGRPGPRYICEQVEYDGRR